MGSGESEQGGETACVGNTQQVREQTNLECWGSDESWDLWREESEGGRKKNTQSMRKTQDLTRAQQYLQITFQAGWRTQRVVLDLRTIQAVLFRMFIRSLNLKHSPATAQWELTTEHRVHFEREFLLYGCLFIASVIILMEISYDNNNEVITEIWEHEQHFTLFGGRIKFSAPKMLVISPNCILKQFFVTTYCKLPYCIYSTTRCI